MDRREVVDPCDTLDPEALVSVLERQTIDELHQTGDRLASSEVSNIDAFDPAGERRQLEYLLQPREPFLGIDKKYLRLRMFFEIAAQAQVAEGLEFVAQARGVLELQIA